MGNDPGRKVDDGQTSRIVIEVKGPLDEKEALAFKTELEALLRKYAPKKYPAGEGMKWIVKKSAS